MPPVPSPEDVPAPIVPPLPPVRETEDVAAHVETVAPAVDEPLFTIKVWQLGFAVIAVMLALLYFVGII